MSISHEEIELLLHSRESEHLEFKEAKASYSFDDLVKYCVALANELGGKIILGVTDKIPRKIVGTAAFTDLERTKNGLNRRIPLRIHIDEILDPDGRVLIFTVPPRPVGMPIHDDGTYYMRTGESLVAMSPDKLKKIFNEDRPDFTAEICPDAGLVDLEKEAIEDFRIRWMQKSRNENIRSLTIPQLLADAELLTSTGLTYAALILFGTHQALGKFLPQSEVIFEYRSSEASGPAQHRQEFRRGFFGFYENLWQTINLRNDQQHYQDGLFIRDILTFNESAVREAILNDVSHRDYRMGGSVFVRQFPRRLEIVSPGGFPSGITLDNFLWQQQPRNRRIAESFARCGLVERAGQGMNRIFEACIKESKPKPDFTFTDENHVGLTLQGQVQNTQFLKFLELIGKEKLESFSTGELLTIDGIFNNISIASIEKGDVSKLIDSGIIEQRNRGKSIYYAFAKKYDIFISTIGTATPNKGMDRKTNKDLLLSHIRANTKSGSRMVEFLTILPDYSRSQVQVLLRELQKERKIFVRGATNAARWYPLKPI